MLKNVVYLMQLLSRVMSKNLLRLAEIKLFFKPDF